MGLIVWATPRLARRCGVAEVSALWLGAANPLLIMHLVAGIHNEAPMLGLMLAGTEFALRGDRLRASAAAPAVARHADPPADWAPLGMLLAGAVLITLSSQMKLPSLLALGFVAMALARRWGGNLRAFLLAGGLMAGLSLAVMAAVGWASRLGFGWIYTLGTANVVRSWMSPPTLMALGTGQVGMLLGLGDHTTAVLSLTRGIGVLDHRGDGRLAADRRVARPAAPGRRARRRAGRHGAAVPVVQPWYLLWAIIPLAAWATRPGFRMAAIVVTLVVGIFGPTANGDRFALFQIVDATVASTVIVLLLIAATYTGCRGGRCRERRAQRRDPAARIRCPTSQTPPPTPLPGAYADPREPGPRHPRAACAGCPSVRLGREGDHGRLRPRPGRTRRRGAGPAGPQRRGQNDDGGDVRGIRPPRCGQHRGARTGPDRRQRAAAPAHRRDVAGRRRLSRGPCRRDAQPGGLLRRHPLDPQWLLNTLGLTDAARTTYRRLSGGQQQRLALACALVGRPELVFLDEPTAGMDAQARLLVWELIDALRRDGVTVVLTTHQLKEAEELADRLVIIDHGVTVAAGTPAELTRSGAKDQLRFSAPPRLDLSLLVSALPEDYRATEVGARRVPGGRRGRPAGAGDRHGVVRANRRAGHRACESSSEAWKTCSSN